MLCASLILSAFLALPPPPSRILLPAFPFPPSSLPAFSFPPSPSRLLLFPPSLFPPFFLPAFSPYRLLLFPPSPLPAFSFPPSPSSPNIRMHVATHHSSARVSSRERAQKCYRFPVFTSAFAPLFAPFPSSNRGPDTTPNPRLPHLRLKISVSSIDRCPPFRAKRKDKGGFNLRVKNLAHFFPFRAALSRAWSRMTGVGNSLK